MVPHATLEKRAQLSFAELVVVGIPVSDQWVKLLEVLPLRNSQLVRNDGLKLIALLVVQLDGILLANSQRYEAAVFFY